MISLSSFSSIAEPQGKRAVAYVMRKRTVCILFSVPDAIKISLFGSVLH